MPFVVFFFFVSSQQLSQLPSYNLDIIKNIKTLSCSLLAHVLINTSTAKVISQPNVTWWGVKLT